MVKETTEKIVQSHTSVWESMLLELCGLDPMTATMYWMRNYIHSEKVSIETRSANSGDELRTRYGVGYGGGCLPCWSAGCLMRILPTRIGDLKDGMDLEIRPSPNASGGWFVCYENRNGGKDNRISFQGETLMNALCKTVGWLLQSNHIKKQWQFMESELSDFIYDEINIFLGTYRNEAYGWLDGKQESELCKSIVDKFVSYSKEDETKRMPLYLFNIVKWCGYVLRDKHDNESHPKWLTKKYIDVWFCNLKMYEPTTILKQTSL